MIIGFKLYDPDMNELKFPDGVMPLDFLVSSIEKTRYTEEVKGIPGLVDYGFDYKTRNDASLAFWMDHHRGEYDYHLLVSEINELLDSQSYFYVSCNNLPTRILKIVVDSAYMPERIQDSKYANLEVPVEVIDLPFWRTKYTTQDIEKNGYNAVVEKFGMADGIHMDYLTYTPKTNTFSIWNGGNVTIDPRHFDLSIRILYATSKGDVTIENLTTGEKFIFKRQFENTHLNIFGSRVMLGSTNWLRESNRKFISLAPGENKIKISNVEHQGVSFDFPFYYK